MRDVRGAFNVAAEPVLDRREFARLLGARPLPVPVKPLRIAVRIRELLGGVGARSR